MPIFPRDDGFPITVRSNDQDWLVSWHVPLRPPVGTPHGACGICVTDESRIVVVSRDGERWELPAGRPDGDETWEETLRRGIT
ncbi:MAG: NUDIX hydrolase [Streptosporangiaceae bacterium]